MPTHRTAGGEAAGITVLEVLIGMAIGTIIIVALVRFMVIGFPVSRTSYFQARANETVRIQLQRIAKAIREARPADTGAYPLVEAGPQKLVFYSDVDGDGLTERLRYELVGTQLERGRLIPTGQPLTYVPENEDVAVVASHVRNDSEPIFTYYDGDYPTAPVPLNPVDVTEVKYIDFYLSIDVAPEADPPPVELRSQVQLRNLKTNLAE